ncbi:hypothetical protein FD97_25305 [Salmonella enterica subsp. enterica serovar Muenchen]|nr:hypothetical protein [Salmonella enterica subsp. enterica serovar Muenchen]
MRLPPGSLNSLWANVRKPKTLPDISTLFRGFVIFCYPALPPRFARCSTPHRHGLKSASVHRFLKPVKSMMPSPRVNLVKC